MNNILLEVNFLGISKMNIFRRLVFILVLILIAGCVTTEQSVSDPSQLTGQTIEPAFMTISVPPPKKELNWQLRASKIKALIHRISCGIHLHNYCLASCLKWDTFE